MPNIGKLLDQSARPVMRVEYPGGIFLPGDSAIAAVRRMMDLHPHRTNLRLGFGQPLTSRVAREGWWERWPQGGN